MKEPRETETNSNKQPKNKNTSNEEQKHFLEQNVFPFPPQLRAERQPVLRDGDRTV